MSVLLHLDKFSAAYGEVPVVSNVALDLAAGEIMALTGRNGMGKTTLLRGIMGLAPVRYGTVQFAGADIMAQTTEAISRAGIAYVPAGREIFGTLSVRENLVMCERGGEGANKWTFERVMALFPRLGERINHGGKQLSGGEQQMLAIARILRTGARLLLLDEPTEGLAPVIIQQIGKTIRALKEQQFTILLVEQNFRFASTVADRFYIVEHGKIIDTFANSELQTNMEKLHTYLGV